MANYIKKTIPGSKKKILLITGDTANDDDTLNKIRDLDKVLAKKKYYYLLYSPAISTGVDIPQAAKTNVYHVLQGIHLSAHTHYQMT